MKTVVLLNFQDSLMKEQLLSKKCNLCNCHNVKVNYHFFSKNTFSKNKIKITDPKSLNVCMCIDL